MFPEGKGEAILTAEVENVAKKVNGLLVDAKAAVKSFWEGPWLALEPQWLTHSQPLRLVCMAPLRVSCAAGRQCSTPRCAGCGRLFLGLQLVRAAAGIEGRC